MSRNMPDGSALPSARKSNQRVMTALRALAVSAPVSLVLLSSSPVEAQQTPYQIGPRTLSPAPKDEARAGVPLVRREATQNIAWASRLTPTARRIIGGEPAPA